MVRPKSKVQLKLIEDTRQRTKTYRTRKEGLKKAAHDLAILCDISVLVICVNPKTGEVESWPNKDQETRDIIARYQSHSSTVRCKNKQDSMSVFKGQILKFPPNLKHAQSVDLQLLDSRMKLVSERIQLLENQNKFLTTKESSQVGRITFWQDLMRDAIGVDDPHHETSAAFVSHSEYEDGALVGFELDPFPFNPPEN